MSARITTRTHRLSPGLMTLVGAALMLLTFAVDAMTGLNPAGAAAVEPAQAETAQAAE